MSLLEPIVQYLTMQLGGTCNGNGLGGWQVLFAALDFFSSLSRFCDPCDSKKKENTDFFGEREMDTILDRYTTYYIGGTDCVPFICLGKGEVFSLGIETSWHSVVRDGYPGQNE